MSDKTIPVNNQPLHSGIFHGFDTGYAMAYGVDEAIMIRNLQFFIQSNANRGHNFHKGRFWTYDKLEDFPNHFPYWTIKQIRRILKSLIDQKVIIRDEFNKAWSERTSWYAFLDQEKFVPNIKPPKVPTPVPESEPPPSEIQINSPVMPKWANDRCPNGQLTNVETGISILDTSTITTSISSSSPLMVHAEPSPADAVGMEMDDDPPKKKSEFSAEVLDLTEKMISVLQNHSKFYRRPKKMQPSWEAVHDLLKSSPTPERVLELLTYAVKDTEAKGTFPGWSVVIYTKSPIIKFCEKAQTIEKSLQSKPKREFCPSSDDEKSRQCVEEMMKGAL